MLGHECIRLTGSTGLGREEEGLLDSEEGCFHEHADDECAYIGEAVEAEVMDDDEVSGEVIS